MPLTPGWRDFYESAQQQSVIDPAVVTAIAISESGWNANGRNVNLGIDSNGTPGLPGTPGGIGNRTHQFYTYSSGLEAAQGLAAYLGTPLYRGTNALSLGPERMLGVMVEHGYSGCNAQRGGGGECDPNWDFKILQLRSQVIGTFGLPTSQQPIPGSGIGGLTPVQGGGTPNPVESAGQAVGGAASAVQETLLSWQDSLSNLLNRLRSPGFWWAVLLFGGALAAIVGGVLIYFHGSLNVGRMKA